MCYATTSKLPFNSPCRSPPPHARHSTKWPSQAHKFCYRLVFIVRFPIKCVCVCVPVPDGRPCVRSTLVDYSPSYVFIFRFQLLNCISHYRYRCHRLPLLALTQCDNTTERTAKNCTTKRSNHMLHNAQLRSHHHTKSKLVLWPIKVKLNLSWMESAHKHRLCTVSIVECESVNFQLIDKIS